MSAATYKPAAQTIMKWLRDNGQALGGLTGTDARALRAAVQIIELYNQAGSGSEIELALAFGSCVRQMQPTMRYLAYHAIAHVMDWHNRAEIWAVAGLEPLRQISACNYGPDGQMGRAAA